MGRALSWQQQRIWCVNWLPAFCRCRCNICGECLKPHEAKDWADNNDDDTRAHSHKRRRLPKASLKIPAAHRRYDYSAAVSPSVDVIVASAKLIKHHQRLSVIPLCHNSRSADQKCGRDTCVYDGVKFCKQTKWDIAWCLSAAARTRGWSFFPVRSSLRLFSDSLQEDLSRAGDRRTEIAFTSSTKGYH